MISEIKRELDNAEATKPYESQLTLDQHILKLVHSRQSLKRVTISNADGVNVRHRMHKLQKKNNDFDFSYFYFSKLSRQTDWLTAISGNDPTCSRNHQNRHSPGSWDWHNMIMKLSRSPRKTFVIVLDNATENRRFMKMKRNLDGALWHHRKYLRPAVKYLLVKRKESQPISI